MHVHVGIATLCAVASLISCGPDDTANTSSEPSSPVDDLSTEAEAEARHRAEMERLRTIIEKQESEDAQYREALAQWERVKTNVSRRLKDPNFYKTPKVQECLALERHWRSGVERTDSMTTDTEERKAGREKADRLRMGAFQCWVEALLLHEDSSPAK